MPSASFHTTDKLVAHPEILRDLRGGGGGSLIHVHLMPQNLCNHGCEFCSYRLPDNKNSEAFDEMAAIPWDQMVSLLDDCEEMGVQGMEVTGGGEPMAYPYSRELWEDLATRPFRTALVTNGTLMRDLAPVVTRRMRWARVSIDAASPTTYGVMRKCPESHFERAWAAVRDLRDNEPEDPEFRLGVSFILSNANVGEVYEFVRRAKDSGADNARLSATYCDALTDYFTDKDAVVRAVEDAERAVSDFSDDTFRVYNLIPSRLREIEAPAQDYAWCVAKDLLCVIEGEGKVYTCCTFAGSLKGLYGNFMDHPGGFKGLWEEKAGWRRDMDAREYCKVQCCYRGRNLSMNGLIAADEMPDPQERLHKEFV